MSTGKLAKGGSPDESMMDLESVLGLEGEECLEFIKSTIIDLIRISGEHRLLTDYDDSKQTECYQKALQKLESEVRNHIKIEQQMKLHIENTQAKADESDQLRVQDSENNKKIIDGLNKEINQLERKIQDMEKSSKSSEKIHEMDRKLKSCENEMLKLRQVAEDKTRDCDRMRGQYDKLKAHYYRTKEAIQRTKENSQNVGNTDRSLHGGDGSKSEVRLGNLKRLMETYSSRPASGKRSVSPVPSRKSMATTRSPLRSVINSERSKSNPKGRGQMDKSGSSYKPSSSRLKRHL